MLLAASARTRNHFRVLDFKSDRKSDASAFSLAWGRCCGGGSDGIGVVGLHLHEICVVGLQIHAPIAAVSSRALWQFGRGRGEKSPYSAFDCCRRERTRPLAAHVVDSTPCCAWDDVSRCAIGFGSLDIARAELSLTQQRDDDE